MARRHDPRRPVQRRAEVVAIALTSNSRVHPHPDTDRDLIGPHLGLSADCAAAAASTASSGVQNAAANPSPAVENTTPRRASIAARTMASCRANADAIASG